MPHFPPRRWYQFRLSTWFVLVAILAWSFALTPQSTSAGELSVAIAIEAEKNPPSIDFDGLLSVVLKNTSQHPIRIWNPDLERGYYQLSVQFVNQQTKEKHIARKRRIAKSGYWQAVESEIASGSETLEIPPQDDFTIRVSFGNFAWGEPQWEGLPAPNSGETFSVSALFEFTAKLDSPSGPVWGGKIASDAISATLVAPRLKTPNDYIENGFSRHAIDMMKVNPKLISKWWANHGTPLHCAAAVGDPDACAWLLDNGADVNAIANNHSTPLHFASNVEVVELILKKQPDLSIRDTQGRTPLQDAVTNFTSASAPKEQEKWRQIVDRYLKAGADYDVFVAIHLDDLKRVKELLHKSPNLANDFQGESPLRIAASLGRLEIARYLVRQNCVDVNDFQRGNGYPIIKEALAYPQVVKLLIENGADLKTRITWQAGRTGLWIIGDDATTLHHAASDGVPETIKLLIDNGVDIFATAHHVGEQDQQTALEVAAIFGKAENAVAILSHPKFNQADAKLRQALLDKCLWIGASPAWYESAAARPQLIEAFLAKGANPNTSQNGATVVQTAAEGIRPNKTKNNQSIQRIVALLIAHGAKVDLFSAVAIGDQQAVERLLKESPGAADARGPDGYPALHFAVEMNNKDIVAALLKAGAKVDIRNRSESTGTRGGTALHCAAFWDRYEIAKILIDAGADVNALADGEITPLHEAARLTSVSVAELLLDRGANLAAQDSDGQTPLDTCRQHRWKNAAQIEKLFRARAVKEHTR